MSKKGIRYKYISESIYKLFKQLNINSYPIDLEYVIKELNDLGVIIEIEKYSDYASHRKISIKKVEQKLKSKYGATTYFPKHNFYIIFYNDTNQTEGRINWTIAHEIGHIVLKHHGLAQKHLLSRGGLSSSLYNWLEDEAEWFTQEFICSPIILSKCGLNTANDIKSLCNISGEASDNRLKNIKNISSRYINDWDYKILGMFDSFIQKFKSLSKNKYCTKCGKKIKSIGEYSVHICTPKYILSEDENMIYDDNIKLDSNGRVIKCPKCENEVILGNSNFCHICGTYIIQKCLGIDETEINDLLNLSVITGCGCTNIPGNARFCPECGSITSFYYQSLLKDWTKNPHQNLFNPSNAITSTNYADIDDLPF